MQFMNFLAEYFSQWESITKTIKIAVVAVLLIGFYLSLYKRVRTPKLKEVRTKQPKVEQLKKKKKHRAKYFRRLRIPYRGKTKMYQYDKKAPYINAAWEEVEK